MPYDRALADRVRAVLSDRDDVAERQMFGGLTFMVRGHMCCGVAGDDLMVRLGSDAAEAALAEPHVRPMDFTGRPLAGFAFVAAEGVEEEASLRSWITRAVGLAH